MAAIEYQIEDNTGKQVLDYPYPTERQAWNALEYTQRGKIDINSDMWRLRKEQDGYKIVEVK